MDIVSFLVGFASASVFFIYQGVTHAKKVRQKTRDLTLKLQPTRQAIIERVGDKLHVLDGKTNKFLGEFTTWSNLAELLISIDGTATWSIKHDIPELDKSLENEQN